MNQQFKDLQSLEERVSNLHQRVLGYKANSSESNMPKTSFIFNSNSNDPQQFQIAPTQLEFYDENWRDVIGYLHSNDKVQCYKALISIFDDQMNKKADLAELPEKADRQYVDYLLREISFASKKLLDEQLNTKFSGIHDQLEQTRADVATMKQHFDTQIEALKKELNHFKRALVDPSIDEDETVLVVQERHVNHHQKQSHVAPTSNLLPRIQRPKVFKDTYRKRTRPYVPQDLENIIKRDILIPK
ncbi:hypothetical protein TRFO_23051 [Tritrichomonas foetus]|uniref:Uncharacterized protein n=1 Tax=Tritrichomonas foetus TaxID=1144522 RepID=A0A1J4KAJ4_9EUKA|nr:hypothetical protein TRFO_23051 [Tritrichomonas foetus]|eukprot:OHT08449.1 hypothetical protein TRFO_23051 [Tritrichomonas foetus]